MLSVVKLTFAQVAPFVADWKRLGLSDEDLQALEALLMLDPTAGPVMAGTGGLRKIRFSPPSWRTGKSGAARVCYALVPQHFLVYLVVMFGKNEKGNLSKAERNAAANLLKQLAARLPAPAKGDQS